MSTPLNILVVHNTYQQAGGEDAVFEAEARLLSQQGHQVQTLVFDNNTINGPLATAATGLQVLYNRTSAKRLQTTIAAFQPDVMHVHNFFPLASPALYYIARQQNTPVVQTLHNFRLICPSALLYRQGAPCELCIDKTFPWPGVQHQCYRQSSAQTAMVGLTTGVHKLLNTWRTKVDHYIVLSEFARQVFERSSLGIPHERLSVKPNFVEDKGHNTEDRGDALVYIGRLASEKGVPTLLEAFKDTTVPLKLIGTGPLEADVKAASAHNPLIEYLGYPDKATILDTLKQAKALIFPSVCYENFPITLAEALATGTPVVVSSLGSPPLIIPHEVAGLHFESGNPESLRTITQRLLNDDALRQQLSYNARTLYETHYTPEKNYAQLLDIYHRVIHDQKG